MDKICNDVVCTGCGLCVSRCPKSCIDMYIGELGHLYPVVNQDWCIDCGLCRKGCPSLHKTNVHFPLGAYAAWAKDESDYKSSTSGAIASVLSQYIIEQGGVVYGCAVCPDVEVKHVRIDKKEELYKLKGSKYVQSNIIEVLPRIKVDIKSGCKVLFIGTPCQNAAVKGMYKIQPDNLFLVDLICHGVPSLKVLQNHVKNLVGDERVTDVRFREGNEMCLLLLQENRVLYRCSLWQERYRDFYINAFIDGFTYRKSCHQCCYAKPERVSDMTIGDFWGLGKQIPCDEIPEHENGISVALPNSDKGMSLIKSIFGRLNIYERTVEEAVRGNEQLRTPKMDNNRIILFRILKSLIGIKCAYKIVVLDKIIKRKMSLFL